MYNNALCTTAQQQSTTTNNSKDRVSPDRVLPLPQTRKIGKKIPHITSTQPHRIKFLLLFFIYYYFFLFFFCKQKVQSQDYVTMHARLLWQKTPHPANYGPQSRINTLNRVPGPLAPCPERKVLVPVPVPVPLPQPQPLPLF